MKSIKPEPASPGYRRHEPLIQYAANLGAFMSLRAIQKIATLNRQPIRADCVIITENPVNKERWFYAGTAEIFDTHSQSGITERSALQDSPAKTKENQIA